MDQLLLNAVKSKNIDLVKELLDKGANIEVKNEKGQTPLFIATRYSGTESSNEIVKLLLDRGANIEAKTYNENTPLAMSVINTRSESNIETVKLLLKYGADINSKNNKTELTPLMLAVSESNADSDLETVKILLDYGADINAKSIDGWTPLLLAVKYSDSYSNLETVKLLLERGADPFIKIGDYKISDNCPTNECKDLISKYIWKRLYERDMDTAKRYGRSVLNKDVWELILLNKRQTQLCQKLSSEKNREVLKYFAMELDIPVTDNMTKAKLCGLISRYLAYNKYFSEKGKEYTEKKLDEEKQYIKDLASRYNLDRNKPIDELLKDLSYILK